jgi:hypothetical protein
MNAASRSEEKACGRDRAVTGVGGRLCGTTGTTSITSAAGGAKRER